MLCLTRFFVISLILIAVLATVSSATEWEGPLPDTMNELFEYTEEALDLEGYRTRELTINEDIFIQIPDEIGLALNYDGSSWEDIVHMCVGRIKFETLAAKLIYLYPNGEAFFDATDPDLTIGTGYAYGTFAFPKPSSEGFSCSDINTYPGALNATGVLFLPGFGQAASALDTARISAFLSTDANRVFVFQIAPPIHRVEDAYTFGDIDDEFLTLNVSSEYRASVGPAIAYEEDANRRKSASLMYGFRDADEIEPDHSLFWSYMMAGQAAVNVFHKYFAEEAWTNGKLIIGGISFGAEIALGINEADPGVSDPESGIDRITGVFTMSSHGSNKDNFIVSGMKQTINVVEAGDEAPQILDRDLRAAISCDCDQLLNEEIPIIGYRSYCQVPSRKTAWMDNMVAACRAVKFWSPINYASGNTPLNINERPILVTSGVMDESWSVRGLVKTYLAYRNATPDLISLQLLPDYDHMRYYLGAGAPPPKAGLWNGVSYLASSNLDFMTNLFYPNSTSVVNYDYETYMNADYQGPDKLEFALNQQFRSIRSFIHSVAGTSSATPQPPTPFHPDTGLPEARIEKFDSVAGQVDFVVTACFDGSGYTSSLTRVPRLMFGVTLDKFWNVLPACVDEEEATDDDTEDGVYAVDAAVNDYTAECYERSSNQYPYRCATEIDPDRTLLEGVSNTETDAIENQAGHEGWVCRQVRARFDDEDPFQTDFTAWAEVRDFDETTSPNTYLGARSTIPTRHHTFPWDSDNFGKDQCIRPTPPNILWRDIRERPFHDLDALFADPSPTCTNGYMTVWPTADDPVPHYVDARGYNVIVEVETEIDVPESVQVIYTDCDITIEAGAEFRENFEENDFEQSSLALVGRNVTIAGTIAADAPGARTISIYGRESVTISEGALVSAASAEDDGASHITLAGDGTLTLAGRLDTDAPNAAGAISAEFRDITVAETAQVSAIADPQNTGSRGGMVFIEAKDTMTVEDEYATPSIDATGDEDGAVGVSFCTGDESPAAIDPPPAVATDRCLIADVDLDDVDWCEGYSGADTCCTPDDPCGYGFDGLCQCADSCEWDVMDCTGAPVGIQVFDADGEGQVGIVGAECVIVDNETGEPVEPEISTTSNANGYCWFPSINGAETFSVRVTHDDYLTEYLFNLPSPALPQAFMFPTAILGDLEEYFEIEIDPEDGIVLGLVLWGGPGGVHEMVGCAEVTNDSGQNTVFYSDENGPNPLRTATHPENSVFMVFNVPEGGPYDFNATVDETDETETTVPQVFASSVTMTYLVYGEGFETNPTPTGCE